MEVKGTVNLSTWHVMSQENCWKACYVKHCLHTICLRYKNYLPKWHGVFMKLYKFPSFVSPKPNLMFRQTCCPYLNCLGLSGLAILVWLIGECPQEAIRQTHTAGVGEGHCRFVAVFWPWMRGNKSLWMGQCICSWIEQFWLMVFDLDIKLPISLLKLITTSLQCKKNKRIPWLK